MYVIDTSSGERVLVEITKSNSRYIPLKKNGWLFNWRLAYKNQFSKIYLLRKKEDQEILGALELMEVDGRLIMNLIEVSPDNKGKNKSFERIAGILIGYACKETFKLETNYKGFLIFDSKTELIEYYEKQYGATRIVGQKMVIGPQAGKILINKFLKNEH